ncbi:helix-turn-helix transcriptional regulator [Pseudoalteromonas luteoviolacea]|uniref:HTH cro/C1-type domain-containing protein n=1 Tax=Pseudoalteromonas luteoviolacea S4054 TaxID=1129367 RepID=A0A0F6ADT1_9GAMM|nr:helix-turn-helix transcriptional regulator [Pseudoalteromonas luteoviolacea]AOT09582.1 MerR family transcriptional regulator [Pseudoalteromonas luteoviolacea]AOT14494.1 MerR family transcriptional regulator [Pseudoalteromonas luteoviolacea]AOT19409.1 MerR family transcriptional regulator [Pseudoalteromonas luteoviolacea]KKE83559.1 hypothetical protein N479_13390 [Pseudoalteromonas luteoviolacea S4054]KZN69132.1 hypothetical protein N481_22515 [Pseudoalteromonas luteoviolacea S4047-1]
MVDFFARYITGDDLRALRKKKGVTTAIMAKHLGVCRKTYENWERDVGQPKLNQFFAICAFCSIDLSELISKIRSHQSS